MLLTHKNRTIRDIASFGSWFPLRLWVSVAKLSESCRAAQFAENRACVQKGPTLLRATTIVPDCEFESSSYLYRDHNRVKRKKKNLVRPRVCVWMWRSYFSLSSCTTESAILKRSSKICANCVRFLTYRTFSSRFLRPPTRDRVVDVFILDATWGNRVPVLFVCLKIADIYPGYVIDLRPHPDWSQIFTVAAGEFVLHNQLHDGAYRFRLFRGYSRGVLFQGNHSVHVTLRVMGAQLGPGDIFLQIE